MALFSFLRRILSAPAAASVEPVRAADATGAFPVLLAAIEGEGGTTAAAAVQAALDGAEGLRLLTTSAGIGSVDDAEVVPASLGKAVARARALAEAEGAAVVVAGQMIAPGQVRLRFIPGVVTADPAAGTWSVGDMLDVPIPLPPGGGGFIAACAAASMALATDEERRVRLGALRNALRDGERLVHGDAAPLSGSAKAVAAVSYAAMLAEMGIRTHQQPVLDRAQQVLRAIVGKGAKAGQGLPPVVVAAARLHLGAILADSGSRDGDPVRLEEAGHHFQAAAEVITGDALPDDNAALWTQYGRAMQRLSALSGKTDHMKEAVQGYRLAAGIWTKGSNAERWAELQYGMATVLGQYGEFTGSVPVLDRAVTVFEAVAEVWTRESNARRWAGLQNNIGACRFAQGKRSGDLPPLRDAAERFSRALEVYVALNMTRNVHVTQKNIARVERLIAVQEGKG
ncbi:hypothetical protein ACM64Y_05885 [Novispirillum sp. DQ9]|uniref:hypothetical protein n=1 Tax=Novispirillum sp. DQ9 TaxID=3398612 RepID=UPI003C7D9F42